jgi:hypothetical protein
MPTKVYDRTIEVLKSALISAKLGSDERRDAIRRLDEQTRRLKRHSTDPLLPDFIAVEQQRSHEYGGRSVFGWEPASVRAEGSGTSGPAGVPSKLDRSR